MCVREVWSMGSGIGVDYHLSYLGKLKKDLKVCVGSQEMKVMPPYRLLLCKHIFSLKKAYNVAISKKVDANVDFFWIWQDNYPQTKILLVGMLVI